jgi:cytochrome c
MSCKKGSSESFGKPETTVEVQNPIDLGAEIFNGKGTCVACHAPDSKLIGPSLHDIAKIYKEKNGNMIDFLKGKSYPIVDPSEYEVMKTNLELTKTFSQDELKALESYMLSFMK